MSTPPNQEFIRQMRKKVEEEMLKKEREVLEYWRGEVERIIKRRHQDLAGLLNDLRGLSDRMDRRLKTI